MVDSRPLSVLVVEDEAVVNEMILAQVRNLGYTVAGSAYDGAEAVELAHQLHPDVVLMDLQMPNPLTGQEDRRAGLDAAIQIQKSGIAPVVLLTAYESPELVQQASAAGVGAYLVKPVRDNDLSRAITIARARFEDATTLHRQNEYLAALHETTLGLMNRLELMAVLENILARATQLLGTPHGYIYLAEPGETEIHNRVGSGVFASLRRSVRAGEGLTGRVWQTGQPVVVNDYETWPERLPDADLAQVKAVIGVPLKSGAHVTGVIGVARPESGQPFTRSEVDLLSGFAQLASIALDNARLYETVQRELAERKRAEAELRTQKQLFENLVAVARVTAERPTLEATLRNALDVTTALTGAEYGALFLLDPSGAVTHLILPPSQLAHEQRRDVIASVMDRGLAGWVARHRRAVLIPDTTLDERWLALPSDPSNAHSALSVPILSGETLVGVLTLTHTQPNRFTTGHLHLLQAAANQMALALRNAQVFEAQRRMADRQTVLYQVLRTASQQLDPDNVLRQSVQAIVDFAGWPNVSLALPDKDRAHWIIHAASGRLASMRGLTLPIRRGVTGRVLRTGKTQWVPDVSVDPDYVAGHPAIRSELAVPLRRGEHVQGVLNFESDLLAAFDADDVLLTESLAEVIALTLDNARLYQAALDERGRLQALVESSRDGIILGGMDGRILVINTPAVQFLRLPGQTSDWLGRSMSDVLRAMRRYAPTVVRATIAEMRRIAQVQEMTGEDEYDVPPRTIHWLNLPVQAGAAPLGRLMVLRDVTQERAAGALREDVTRMMVHDLRNPVGTILTALELLATDTAAILSVEQRRTLDIARTGAQRLLDLVNGILDVSQLESGQISLDWARIQLDHLIGETLRTQLPAIKARNLTLESDVPPTLPAAWADAELVGRVLQNLMSNAIKFTPEGGAIRVTARVEKNDRLLVSISDTGSGIPPDIQSRLFLKFVRGRQVGRGSGLGLAFCKLALEAHGERIWVDSTSERGTTITFSLAMAPGA